jgi:SP family sugar porter-like MFS transporter
MQSQTRKVYLWSICLTAAMGGLLFGYDWVVIGGAKPFYEAYFHLTTAFQIGWAMSSALVGCLVGSIFSGGLSDRFGRKNLLILAGLLFTVSAVGTALADSFTAFIGYRLLGGVGIGLASNLSPMYIAEISPAHLRGRLVSVNQLTIVIGILAAQLVNWSIAEPVATGATRIDLLNSWNGTIGWRWMFGAETLPAFLFFGLMFWVPESPRWLVKNGRDAQARSILEKIVGSEAVDTALNQIKHTLQNEIRAVHFRELLEPRLLKILGLGVFLAVFQQWCGINVIFNYAEEVFSQAGYSMSDILLNIVITGSVNLIFTFVALRTVDRWGRRALMLFGAGSLSVIYLLLGGGYFLQSQGVHMLVLVVLAIGAYAMSLAPVTWVIISEIFPNRIRGAAMSIAVTALWSACFILTYTFPMLNTHLGAAGTFWIYAGICVIGFLFIRKRLPETKGKTLEELETALTGLGSQS